MGKAIGIDLGTTNSCAAVIENNQPKIIMYKGGNYTIPSLFAIDEHGKTLVGHDAKKQAQINPQNTVFGAKRLMGRNFHSKAVEKIRQVFTYDMMEDDAGDVLIKVKDKVFNLEQISAEILRKIKSVAEEYIKEEVTNAVITVPAYFNDRQRQAVRRAGKMADMKVLRILNEPTAAALAYGLGRNLRQSLAVYDLGGGTFDVSVIDIHDKVFEVIATGGDTFLGGVDFDDRVMGFIMENFQEKHGIDLSLDRVAIQRIRDVAERAKINLSATMQTKVEIPFIARGPKGILNVDMTFTREALEELTGDLVARTISVCKQIMGEASRSPDQIDEVLLVGGQSRMPLVQKSVVDYFGRPPCKGVHPDEAVAVGAAIMAHSLTSASARKVTLLDVLPMPIGISKVDGTFLKLFASNSEIPAYKSLTLTNSKDNQRSIMLKIYQGESDTAIENELLGTFIFSPIRQAKRGSVKVEVIFHIDSEGILNLSAKDKQTGEPVPANIKTRVGMKKGQVTVSTQTKGGRADGTTPGQTARATAQQAARAAAQQAAGPTHRPPPPGAPQVAPPTPPPQQFAPTTSPGVPHHPQQTASAPSTPPPQQTASAPSTPPPQQTASAPPTPPPQQTAGAPAQPATAEPQAGPTHPPVSDDDELVLDDQAPEKKKGAFARFIDWLLGRSY